MITKSMSEKIEVHPVEGEPEGREEKREASERKPDKGDEFTRQHTEPDEWREQS